MNKDVTIVFVSYHSEKQIKRYLNQLKKSFKILIVENSKNFSLKKLEKKYRNISVIINKDNKGFGSGSNLGLKKIKTKYGLHLDLDTFFSNASINKLVNEAKKIEKFAILGPRIKNFNYNENDFKFKKLRKNLDSMNFIDGCCMLFNMNVIKKIGYFDENFFLYFEETDLIKRCISQKQNVLMANKIYISHIGRSSVDSKYNNEIEVNRNWHYLWSKFYYYKKHYNYIYALYKISNQFFSAFMKSIFYMITGNGKKRKIYFARFSGCLNSILLKKSWYRPNI